MERQKTRVGRVLSNKMTKTVVVGVTRYKVHPIYKKSVRLTKRYKAHDEENACQPGDLVSIVETRPLSKEKRWRVATILSRGDEWGKEILTEESDQAVVSSVAGASEEDEQGAEQPAPEPEETAGESDQ